MVSILSEDYSAVVQQAQPQIRWHGWLRWAECLDVKCICAKGGPSAKAAINPTRGQASPELVEARRAMRLEQTTEN